MMAKLSLSKMPLKNLLAHPARTVVLLLLAAAQAACVFVGASLAAHSQDELSLAEAKLGADVLVLPYEASYSIDMDHLVMQGTPVAAYAPKSDLSRIADCDGISAVSCQLYIPGPADGPSWVIGYEPETDFAISPWIAEGHSFKPASGMVIVGCDVATTGDTLDLYGRSWPVGAHLEETGSELDNSAIMSVDDLPAVIADAMANGVEGVEGVDPFNDYSTALVRVADKANVESVANWLKVYVRKTKAVCSDEALTATAYSIDWQSAAVGVAAIAAWVVLLAAIAVAQSMSMAERKGEFYAWRASGSSRRIVSSVLRREAVALHVVGALAGVVLSAIVVAVAVPASLLPVAPFAFVSLATIVLSALVGLVSASVFARKIMNELDGQMLVAA